MWTAWFQGAIPESLSDLTAYLLLAPALFSGGFSPGLYARSKVPIQASQRSPKAWAGMLLSNAFGLVFLCATFNLVTDMRSTLHTLTKQT